MKILVSFVGIPLILLMVASHCQRLKDPCQQTKPQALDAITEASVIEDASEDLTELKAIQANASSDPSRDRGTRLTFHRAGGHGREAWMET